MKQAWQELVRRFRVSGPGGDHYSTASRTYLDSAAETQFGSVAATVGTLIVVATTLVVLLVFINMIFQYRAMDGRTAFWLAVKIGLIGIFATNWVN